MIGKIYTSVFPYFDSSVRQMKYKNRPVLIIGGPRNNDYTVLPLSTISNSANKDPVYDVEIDPVKYPLLNLTKVSYVRTHKQTTMHSANLVTCLSDVKNTYEDLYIDILLKLEQHNNELMEKMLQLLPSPVFGEGLFTMKRESA